MLKRGLSLLFAAALILGALSFTACKKNDAERCEYDIYATYDEASRSLSGEMAVTYYNYTDTEISELKFNLFGNAFREDSKYRPVSSGYTAKAYYDGASYGNMKVNDVRGDVSEWDIAGLDENILTVTLSESVFPDEQCSLEIVYTLELAKVNHRTGVTEHAVNLSNFYPQLCAYDNGFYECEYYAAGDPFYSECADYSVKLVADSDYVVASSGKQTGERALGGNTERSYELQNARDFCFVMSKDFQVLKKDTGKAEVSYYYYRDEKAEESLNIACESIEYFSQTFGAYPYSTYAAVQTGFCYGGMEYPGLSMISDALDDLNNKYTIVHETAHQWWYSAVGSNQLENAWMDEGLTEYSTVMFFENYPAYGLERKNLVQSAYSAYKAFFDVYAQLFGETDTTMNRKLDQFGGEYEYVNVTYNKGLILFDNLREALGDKKFTNALKRYYNEFCYKIAKPEDMVSCFEKVGVDVAGFFASYVEGKAVI